MLHIGAGYLINTASIVGIFDLDKTTYGPKTREFLKKAEQTGAVVSAGYELPKSFIVCHEKGESKVYLSQLASSTLQKRMENKKNKTAHIYNGKELL
ncbi:MAG: DUF370 domain-containing protein [Clostridia bacterium]|nr:DUF370 domain-containing protein [Clostridia bacterium]MBQ1965773.1 DUF370 domain-containing protein [Clostridia bacterium]MBQ5742652.1 DUF370 domain-containing protein [Clostridia bacterium]